MTFERDRLKQFLAEEEIPRGKVAEMVPTTLATLSRILNGRHGLKPSTARRLRAAMLTFGFELNAGQLLLEADMQEPTPVA